MSRYASARSKFKVWDQVKLSRTGLRRLRWIRGHNEATVGIVVGYGPSAMAVKIIRFGLVHPASYHYSFWQAP
jgi:ActR/RegA family two-component response regulator